MSQPTTESERVAEREVVYEAAGLFVRLGQKPERGLATWHVAMEQAYQVLVAKVLATEEGQKSKAWEDV